MSENETNELIASFTSGPQVTEFFTGGIVKVSTKYGSPKVFLTASFEAAQQGIVPKEVADSAYVDTGKVDKRSDFARGFAAAMSECISYHQREVNNIVAGRSRCSENPMRAEVQRRLHEDSITSLCGIEAVINSCDKESIHVIGDVKAFVDQWAANKPPMHEGSRAIIEDCLSEFVSEARLELYYKNLFPAK